MKVCVIYENGVFRPSEEVHLAEHQKLIIHFWPEMKNDTDLESAYTEASSTRPDLEDWNVLDKEDWA